MPSSEQPRVFISYARKDGAALAQRLQEDLTKKSFDAWLDKQRRPVMDPAYSPDPPVDTPV